MHIYDDIEDASSSLRGSTSSSFMATISLGEKVMKQLEKADGLSKKILTKYTI